MAGKPHLLSAEEILKGDDTVFETVEVPQWGGSVRIRSLTGKERDSLEGSMMVIRGQSRTMNYSNFRAKTVALAAVDLEGHRLFTDQQVEVLGARNAGALDTVFTVAARLSGLTTEDIQKITGDLGNGSSAEAGSA